jgi:hypothetical protein
MKASSRQFTPIRIGIIALTVATAAIHLILAFAFPNPMFTTMFVLNGLGYLLLLAAYFLPQFDRDHNLVRWLLIAFASVTVIGYFVFNAGNFMNPVGLIDKVIEVALIVLLFLDGRGR